MMSGGLNIPDTLHIVEGLAPVVPNSSTPDYINLKGARRVEILIHAKNATTVTGSAITLKQATDVSGTNEKALSFTTYFKVEDTAAADAPWTKATAVSDTFTPLATNSKNSIYRIPIDPATLDTTNGFDCIRVATANGVAQTITVLYLIEPIEGGNARNFPSMIV